MQTSLIRIALPSTRAWMATRNTCSAFKFSATASSCRRISTSTTSHRFTASCTAATCSSASATSMKSLAVTDDWEMWLRASRGARFVHVDRVTCEYSWRVDPAKGNMTLTHQRQFAESYEKITSRYAADVREFPNITAQQAQVKAAQQQRAKQLAELRRPPAGAHDCGDGTQRCTCGSAAHRPICMTFSAIRKIG